MNSTATSDQEAAAAEIAAYVAELNFEYVTHLSFDLDRLTFSIV